ncbi:MAG: hypothetical protein BGO90_05400 [Legionella sp. 40-6]|nr:MAG: hypothetical protein BGO90_05400 [Legionella sp. 40-6]
MSIPGIKHLTTFNFNYHLMIYEQVKSSILKSIAELNEKTNLSIDDKCKCSFYEQSLNILIESTFLQLYAELEETLYHECLKNEIQSGSGIKRFERALSNQNYDTSQKNLLWVNLIFFSKVRNCLLHANGRLDIDKYPDEVRLAIKELNQNVSSEIIKIRHLKGHKEGTDKLNLTEDVLFVFGLICRNFIFSQNI